MYIPVYRQGGAEALNHLANQPSEIVILDLGLPDLDGALRQRMQDGLKAEAARGGEDGF